MANAANARGGRFATLIMFLHTRPRNKKRIVDHPCQSDMIMSLIRKRVGLMIVFDQDFPDRRAFPVGTGHNCRHKLGLVTLVLRTNLDRR